MPPILAVTMGDTNGVGPEVLAKAFARADLFDMATPLVLGAPAVYAEARARVPGAPAPQVIDEPGDAPALAAGVPFLRDDVRAPAYRPGTLDPDAGRAAMQWLERAVDLALNDRVDGIVTCPINKEGIHRAGYAHRGHTDFIAQRTGSPSYRMALYAQHVLVVHLTDHVPLTQALDAIRAARIVESVRIANEALERLQAPTRRIAVAGLNPHAGEAGAFGTEETGEILPAVNHCREEGLDCSGPHSPDAVFRHALNGRYDAVVAMYHDQGHIPMKLVAMDQGVNITLGIPIVRTSVDHGTAYDIAGTGAVREHSFLEAYRLAARLAAGARRIAP